MSCGTLEAPGNLLPCDSNLKNCRNSEERKEKSKVYVIYGRSFIKSLKVSEKAFSCFKFFSITHSFIGFLDLKKSIYQDGFSYKLLSQLIFVNFRCSMNVSSYLGRSQKVLPN